MWKNVKTVFRSCPRMSRTLFKENERAYGYKLNVYH